MAEDTQKITAHIPKALLKEAQAVTGKGITETLKIALEQVARRKSHSRLLKIKGAHKFSFELSELRKDRKEK